jgi:hypothetical protein
MFGQMMTPRTILSLFIALAGASLLTYGLAAHRTPVLMEQEVAPSSEPAVDAPTEPDVPDSPFVERPPAPPPPPVAPEKTWVATPESERRLVRDITFGGLTRLDDGRIKRIFSGDGPALCPT